MTLSLPPSHRESPSFPSGPLSPSIHITEDLTRFPTESLHSFSFAHQSEESIHNRHNILKRAIDFMKNKLAWTGNNAGIAAAAAKLSGDVELQSIMELLRRANMVGEEPYEPYGLPMKAPLTGPAELTGENVFEKSFIPFVESSTGLQSHGSESDGKEVTKKTTETSFHLDVTPSSLADRTRASTNTSTTSTDERHTKSLQVPGQQTRASLKRTYTDVSLVSMQDKLSDALAQPYMVGEIKQNNQVISPSTLPTVSQSGTVGLGAHGHGNRWSPANQAVFTTETRPPWTILAANDLACLMFGITKAEMRKIGIMEIVRKERHKWLEQKLNVPKNIIALRSQASDNTVQQMRSMNGATSDAGSGSSGRSGNSNASSFGAGVTAKLLSKPPSRYSAKSKRAKTEDTSIRSGTLKQIHERSRGVIICGDVVPIRKRNGATGSASLWLKEKGGILIWVLEEISEDMAYLTVDEVGCIIVAMGATEAIWGTERVRRGMDITRLIPEMPRLKDTNTGALDYDSITEVRRYTAVTLDNGMRIPVTVDRLSGESTFRVSSFPHIAGIMVVDPSTLKVSSSNTVFSEALFGQSEPNGKHVTEFLPAFDKLLHIMAEEEGVELTDGIVIPEHSFRRTWALMALREGKSEAASLFLQPNGLPAIHRDGARIVVDVQMRVVTSEKSRPINIEDVIDEKGDEEEEEALEGKGRRIAFASEEVVYALWITYSRQIHTATNAAGRVTPLTSRPATPLHQPSPGQSVTDLHPEEIDVDEPKLDAPNALTLEQQLKEAASEPVTALTSEEKNSQREDGNSNEQQEKDTETRTKKSIDDFIILEDMGQGAYGQVKLCRQKKNGGNKAVLKYVTKRRILVDTWTRDRRLGTVPLEIHVLDYLRRDGLKHPNIVEMADFFEDDQNYYIEMVPHGLPGMDLFDYIELRVNMSESECRKIFVQVANALHHLHLKAKVVHRDIKDENVILDGEGKIKLIDFGSAAYVRNGPFDVFVGTIGE